MTNETVTKHWVSPVIVHTPSSRAYSQPMTIRLYFWDLRKEPLSSRTWAPTSSLALGWWLCLVFWGKQKTFWLTPESLAGKGRLMT